MFIEAAKIISALVKCGKGFFGEGSEGV